MFTQYPPFHRFSNPYSADRSGRDYDYADLAAAMDSGDDSDDVAASGSDLDSGSDEEEAGGSGRVGSKFEPAASDEDDSEGGSGSGSGSDEEDGEEPAGATFSDMSDSDVSGSLSGGSEEEEEEEGLSGGSGSEEDNDSDSDGGFEAELAADDLSDGACVRLQDALVYCQGCCWLLLFSARGCCQGGGLRAVLPAGCASLHVIPDMWPHTATLRGVCCVIAAHLPAHLAHCTAHVTLPPAP